MPVSRNSVQTHYLGRDVVVVVGYDRPLNELGIVVPDSLLEAVYLNQLFHVGNVLVRHHVDQPPEVLLVG